MSYSRSSDRKVSARPVNRKPSYYDDHRKLGWSHLGVRVYQGNTTHIL